MLALYAITATISSPFIFHNIQARVKTNHLINHNKFDPIKKISVTKGILSGTTFKTIKSDNTVISNLNLYKQTIVEDSILGLALVCFAAKSFFVKSTSYDSDVRVIDKHVDTITRFSPNLEFNKMQINSNKIKKIFYDITPIEDFKLNDTARMYENYVPVKNIPINLQFSKFQEYEIKNNTEVYLLKEDYNTNNLIIATLDSRNELARYIAKKYYNKINNFLILIIIMLAYIIAYTIVKALDLEPKCECGCGTSTWDEF